MEFPETGRNNEILSAQRERGGGEGRGAWQGKFYWVNQNHAIALYNKHDRQDNLTHSLHLVTRYECRIFFGNYLILCFDYRVADKFIWFGL